MPHKVHNPCLNTSCPEMRRIPRKEDLLLSMGTLVRAGVEISRGKYGGFGLGTAGLIVRKTGSPTGAWLLTCAHVLGMSSTDGDANKDLVYAPHFKDCCGMECNKPIGKVVQNTLEPARAVYDSTKHQFNVQAMLSVGADKFAVDAALVELESYTFAYNRVNEIGTIAATRDLVAEWFLSASFQSNLDLPVARQIAVRKYGATTQYTEGAIRRLARVAVMEAGVNSDALVFEIEANPAQKPFSGEYELDMDRYKLELEIETTAEVVKMFEGSLVTATIGGSAKTPTLKVVGRAFSQPGDSGAPVVDNSKNIVGLLRSGTFVPVLVKDTPENVQVATGASQAVFIDPVLKKLGVTYLAGGQHTAGARLVIPGMAIERGGLEPADWSHFNEAIARLRAHTGGRAPFLIWTSTPR